MEDICFPRDVLVGAELVDLFFPSKSFFSFLAGLFLRKHLESMLQVLEEDWSIAFVSALTAFSMASSQESRSQSRVSNWAQTEGFRSSRKH